MHRTIYLVLAIVFGLTAMVAGYFATRQEKLKGLIAVESIHDCGSPKQGEEVRHTFELINQMDEELTIKEVVKSCSCSEAKCEPSVLKPGERTKLEAVWKVGGARGKTKVRLTVVAALPDKSLTATELLLVGDVKPDIEYQPVELRFEEKETKKRVTFSPGNLPKFTLKNAYCGHKSFEARIVKESPHIVEVVFRPELWHPDVKKSELEVETSSDNERVCRILLFPPEKVQEK